MGFLGKPQTLPFTNPLSTNIAGQTLFHSFIHSPGTPVNLLGRDLLVATNATILCGPDGLTVTFPNGQSMNCSQSTSMYGQWLVNPGPQDPGADIYWAKLEPETATCQKGALSLFQMWKPWICSLQPYHPPIDPLHCTLYYDREQDEVYKEEFRQIEGDEWTVISTHIYIGEAGVAAVCELNDKQQEWYKMSETAVPHISLALGPEKEARELGPMTKYLHNLPDWQDSGIPDVQFSPSSEAYRIFIQMKDMAILEHETLTRDHGREYSDHEDTERVLFSVPSGVWSLGPFDVGFCKQIESILSFKFQMKK